MDSVRDLYELVTHPPEVVFASAPDPDACLRLITLVSTKAMHIALGAGAHLGYVPSDDLRFLVRANRWLSACYALLSNIADVQVTDTTDAAAVVIDAALTELNRRGETL